MTMVLKIADTVAAVSCDLVYDESSNRKYALAKGAWAPAIAGRRRSALGGAGPYADVEEELAVHVLGDTVAEALANLGRLAKLLDQAEAWAAGDPENPVVVQYQPPGGSLTLQAAVLGRADGDETGAATLPVTFNTRLAGAMIADVRVRFVRRGLWLKATAETSATAEYTAAVATMAPLTTALDVPGPLKITAAGMFTYWEQPGVLLVSDTPNAIQVYGAGTFDDADWVATDDSANYAHGDTICRLTALNTNAMTSAPLALTALPAATTRIAVYAAVRNNSASATWRLQVLGGAAINLAAPEVLIDASTQKPRHVFLGTLAGGSRAHLSPLYLRATPSTAVGSPTLDVNYVAVMALRPGWAQALELAVPTWALPGNVIIDPAALTKPQPACTWYYSGSLANEALTYRGDAYLGAQAAGAYAALLLGAGDYWRQAAFGSLIGVTFTAERLNGYLTPQ